MRLADRQFGLHDTSKIGIPPHAEHEFLARDASPGKYRSKQFFGVCSIEVAPRDDRQRIGDSLQGEVILPVHVRLPQSQSAIGGHSFRGIEHDELFQNGRTSRFEQIIHDPMTRNGCTVYDRDVGNLGSRLIRRRRHRAT